MSLQRKLIDRSAVLYAQVKVGAGASPLPAEADRLITHVEVDSRLHVPDMFEIRFWDAGGDILRTAGLAFGTPVEVWGSDSEGTRSVKLIAGEVTAIEGIFVELNAQTVVRGYTTDHRLQRVRRTRTFVDQLDSEIAGTVAKEAGLEVGTVDPTTSPVNYVVQANQTDWEFLTQRAREIGYEFGVADSTFYFRKASDINGGVPVTLTFRENLRQFQPRITAGNLTPEVEVRVWDPVQAKVIAARSATDSTSAATTDPQRPAPTATMFRPRSGSEPAAGGNSADVGPPPSTEAAVITDLPLPVPGGSDAAPTQHARAGAGRLAGTFAEAEGEALGDGRIVAGAVIQIAGVPDVFAGRWVVTGAHHVFDDNLDGYRTAFTAGGAQDRSLLALAGGPAQRTAPSGGVACGIVTNVNDPEGLGRVKVSLAWLSPSHESDWAPVGQLFAGAAEGALFLPAPGDQVLVAFEFGDVRRPYVVASLASAHTTYGVDAASTRPGKSGVQATGEAGAVVRRGLVTPGGNMLVFHDEVPPNGKGKPLAAEIVLASRDQKIGLSMDQVKGMVTLRCAPETPGTLVIECSGSIELKAGKEGSLTIDGGMRLSLKGETVEINGAGPVSVKGKPIALN